jgi:hypothetical protein
MIGLKGFSEKSRARGCNLRVSPFVWRGVRGALDVRRTKYESSAVSNGRNTAGRHCVQ